MVGKGGIARKGLRLLQYIIKIDLLWDILNNLMFIYFGFSKKKHIVMIAGVRGKADI